MSLTLGTAIKVIKQCLENRTDKRDHL